MLASSLVKEINDTADLLTKRKNYEDTSDVAVNLRKNLADSIAGSIGKLQTFSAKDAGLIATTLATSPYGEFTPRVSTAVDNRLMFSSAVSPLAKDKTATQHLCSPSSFYTAKDWDTFNNKRLNLHIKSSAMAMRLNLLGCTNPHEQTIKWHVAALLLAHFEELPSYNEIYKIMLDFKSCMEANRKSYPYHRLVRYPSSPDDLSDEMYKHAYDADDPPVTVPLVGLETIAKNCIALRANSKLLKSKQSPPHPRVKTEIKTEPCSPASAIPCERVAAQGSPPPPHQHTRDSPVVKAEADDSLFSQFDSRVSFGHQRVHTPNHVRSSVGGVSWGGAPARGRFWDDDVTPVKHEQAAAPADVPIGADAVMQREQDGAGGAAGDLSSYATAAITALASREKTKTEKKNAERRAATEKKREEKAAAAQTAKDKKKGLKVEAKKVVKAEAGVKCAAAKKCKAAKPAVRKRPAAVERLVLTKSNAPMPKPPKSEDAPPTDYKGGRIYWKNKGTKFRVIRRIPNYATERQVSWGGTKPTTAVWKAALSLIDTYKE